ncbi:DUF6531 domain-containing protein [Streptomyces sp. NPDC001544]|uniref:DUF6531 domain-containing protein n=1 Tax=Streptomyces sp. NPDC001544 TaxID=3364584 RepID=UPI0036CEFC7D
MAAAAVAVATAATLALAAAFLPTTHATATGGTGGTDGTTMSTWCENGSGAKTPPVKAGAHRPVRSQPSRKPTDEVYMPWLLEQRAHAKHPASGKAAKPAGTAADPSVVELVPEGQGDVPWHRYTSFAITNALTAKIDYSTGDLMLTARDDDLAGDGRHLRLARTYNSLEAPFGRVAQRWWLQYERYLSVSGGEVIFYDASGATVRFDKNSDGSFTTPRGYAQKLKKNPDGTYTLKGKSGSKETYDADGTLTKVTDRGHGTITVTQNAKGGFRLTDTRSGHWIALTKVDDRLWQAKDNAGRTVRYGLDAHGDIDRTTDTEGRTTRFSYDSSGRVSRISTGKGRVTVFTYDDVNRVTSMLCGTGSHGGAPTGPIWTYTYTSDSATAAGTTTAVDPRLHATKYAHDADGRIGHRPGR